MKLLEFINWAQLAGMIEFHSPVVNADQDYDVNATHYKISILKGDVVTLHIIYAKMNGQALVVRGYLYNGNDVLHRPTMSQIEEAFFPSN